MVDAVGMELAHDVARDPGYETNVLVPDVWWVADDHRPSADALRLDRPPDLAGTFAP